jgi:hypothetical protein
MGWRKGKLGGRKHASVVHVKARHVCASLRRSPRCEAEARSTYTLAFNSESIDNCYPLCVYLVLVNSRWECRILHWLTVIRTTHRRRQARIGPFRSVYNQQNLGLTPFTLTASLRHRKHHGDGGLIVCIAALEGKKSKFSTAERR